MTQGEPFGIYHSSTANMAQGNRRTIEGYADAGEVVKITTINMFRGHVNGRINMSAGPVKNGTEQYHLESQDGYSRDAGYWIATRSSSTRQTIQYDGELFIDDTDGILLEIYARSDTVNVTDMNAEGLVIK